MSDDSDHSDHASETSGDMAESEAGFDASTLSYLQTEGIGETEKDVSETDNEAMFEEELDKQDGKILLSILSQVKYGMDLSKVTLPVFILEPRSFLELLTDFQAHSQLITNIPLFDDPVCRFLAICKWYVSGYHLRPKGVKKPYNPILGETFESCYDHGEHGVQYFVAEQVSHHPPVSAFYSHNMKRQWVCSGYLKPKSAFYGNSAASILNGRADLWLLERDAEHYTCSFPTVFGRGLVFGKLTMEMGGNVEIECPEQHLLMELEFKTKGYFRGKYNEIAGTIYQLNPKYADKKKKKKKNAKKLYTVRGSWDKNIFIKDVESGVEMILFSPNNTPVHQFYLRDEEVMGDFESRKLWRKVTNALVNRNSTEATTHKSHLEENQRKEAKARKKSGEEYVPKYFRKDENGEFWYKDLQKKPFTEEQKNEWLPWYVQPPTVSFPGTIPEEYEGKCKGVLNTPETRYPGPVSKEEAAAEAEDDDDVFEDAQ